MISHDFFNGLAVWLRRGLWLACCLPAVVLAQASSSFVVEDIRIEGLQRVSAGVVFAALPLRVRDTVSEADLPTVVRTLFETGNFDDIQIGRDGGILFIQVQERPAISDITIDGNKILETESLMRALRSGGITEGQVFKRSTLEAMELEVQRQYISQGRYDARVTTEVTSKPRNRVAVHIDINEGTPATVRQISVVGNTVYSQQQLLDQMELRTGGWLSFMTNDNKYSREKLSGDLEKLKSYYMDRGYINVDIESTQVAVSPDREGVYITIHVREGELHTVSSFDLAGDLVLPKEDLQRFVLMREGVVFSQQLMTSSEEILTQRLGNEGYAFAKVTGIPEINSADRTVAVKFFIDPGKRTYVRRIDFRGNTKTVDEVLRREMRQMEGGLASSARIEQSRVRLERLGFFKEVKTENREVPGADDLIDVVYSVEEQPSGSIGASIGFSQDAGLILGANLQQNNFLGTGKQVGIGLSRSKYQSLYRFSYVNPYYTEDGVSRGFNVFFRSTDLSEINIASYTADSYGGSVSFGYPIRETQRLQFSAGYTHTKIKTGMGVVQEIRSSPTPLSGINDYIITPIVQPEFDTSGNLLTPAQDAVLGTVNDSMLWPTQPGFLDIHGDSFSDFPVTLAWNQFALNRGRLATQGYSQQLALEVTLPGSDATYFRLTYTGQYFVPLGRNFSLRFHTDLGYGDGYGDTREMPFWGHFYSGGFGSVRGFKSNTLGPRSTPARQYAYTASKVITDTNGYIVGYYHPAYLTDPSNPGQLLSTQVYADDPDPFGGNVQIEGGVELIFPTPFVKDQRSVRTAAFIDVGNVFSTNCRNSQVACNDIDLGELRYSVGVGLTWITGFGPLTFSVAKALNAGDYDETEVFQFSLGQSF